MSTQFDDDIKLLELTQEQINNSPELTGLYKNITSGSMEADKTPITEPINNGCKTIYVNTTFIGKEKGTKSNPFKTLPNALNSVQDSAYIEILNDEIIIDNSIEIPSNIKFLYLDGKGATIKFSSFDYLQSRSVIYRADDSIGDSILFFENLTIKNGSTGISIRNAERVVVKNSRINGNGWTNENFSLILPSSGTRLGYDSDPADLQNYANNNAQTFRGGIDLHDVKTIEITGNVIKYNNDGIFMTNCGVNGGGFITRNVIAENFTGGLALVASPNDPNSPGTQNIIVTLNAISYNGSWGALIYGGINNKFSQNELTKNWNAALVNYASANLTLRDMSIYNNNFAATNSAGQVFVGVSSIVITETGVPGLLDQSLNSNPNAKFITEILENQIHHTGAGSSGQKTGIYIGSTVGQLQLSQKNVINIDNNRFLEQDIAVDYGDVDITNVTIMLGRNTFIDMGVRAVKQPIDGMYYELPYSNHVSNLNYANFNVTDAGNVRIYDSPSGVILNPYYINELKAVEYNNNQIAIILKDSSKIQFVFDESVLHYDDQIVGGDLHEKINFLNTKLSGTGTQTDELPVITSSLQININQGETLNYTLNADYGVAYEWDFINAPGVTTLNGNDRKIIGGSNLLPGNYTIPVKAINYNGFDSQNITLVVDGPAFPNTKSMNFEQSEWLFCPAALVSSVLSRSGNGSGANDAYTIEFWFKAGTSTNNTQTILYYGAQSSNGQQGNIRIMYQGGNNDKNLSFRLGTNFNHLKWETPANSIIQGQWHHIVVTNSGNATGASSGDISDYYNTVSIFIDGVQQTTTNTNANYGFTGDIPASFFRIGRYSNGAHLRDNCKLDEICLYDVDQSSNISQLYNNGIVADKTLLTTQPKHWWRFENNTFPFVYDEIGNAIITMNAMTANNFNSDVP